MTARTLTALALAILLVCPPLPVQAAGKDALVLAQAVNGDQPQDASGNGWNLRRRVKAPGEVNADLPPAQQQTTPPAVNATAPVALPEPPLPREPAKSLGGKPLPPAKTTTPPAVPLDPALEKAPQATPPAKSPPGALSMPPSSVPVPLPPPPAKPKADAPAGPPSTKSMVAPPKIVPAPEPDKPSPLVATPQKPVLRKGTASIASRRTAEELQVFVNTGGPVDFETFFLQNPPRMIVDVSGDWAIKGPHEMTVNSHGCRTVRLGRHENRLRVVFDLDPGSVYRSETSRTDKGLRILFAK